MSLPYKKKESIQLQAKVFSRWVSFQLGEGKSDIPINDISKDLSDGVSLVELATILIQKDAPHHWYHSPKNDNEMVQNCDLSINMFTKDGVHLDGITGNDIKNNNRKIIISLIWTLILHYSIEKSIDSNDIRKYSTVQSSETVKIKKDILMKWAIDRTSSYSNVLDFYPYELAICALLDSYIPDKINHYKLDPNDSINNLKLAINVMNELKIPVFVYPEDFDQQEKIDKKALLTQLSVAKVILEKLPPPPPPVSETNTDSAVLNCNQSIIVTEQVDEDQMELIPNPNVIEKINSLK